MPYERTTGTALKQVESWCRHLTNGGTFSSASTPSLTQVNDFLEYAFDDIKANLVRFGYGTAAPADSGGLGFLEKLNVMRACIDIEMTYPLTEFDPNHPNPRMLMFTSQWEEGTFLISTHTLDGIGLTGGDTNLSDLLVFTGTSRSRKNSREIETDRVAGKFPRDFGQSPRVSPAKQFSSENWFDNNA